MRRTLIAVVTTLAMAACGGGGNEGGEPAATGLSTTAPASSPGEATTTTQLDGTWAIDEVTADEALAAVRQYGFGRDELGVFLDETGTSEWFGLTLRMQGGSYTLLGSADGDDPGVWDGGSTYTVEDDILTLAYASGGTTTFRWSINGDRLDLELLEDTQGDILGVPADVWVAALFTAEPFTRVGS